MLKQGTILARAESDCADRLLDADEPLAGLQMRCGGTLPGVIAVPELLELVRRVRLCGAPLARTISAFDGTEAITAWVEVEPQEENSGCDILVKSWQASPTPADYVTGTDSRRIATDRHIAELSARLDASQRVLAVASDSSELAALAAKMEASVGMLWTDLLPPEKIARGDQPLHWRLLDGSRVAVEGSERPWRVRLIPQIQPGHDPAGFELLLISDEPAAAPVLSGSPMEPVLPRSLVGQDLSPVLRQPISRIIANAETIRTRLAGPITDAYADYAGEISSAGKLLLDLLEDLADLEVVESESFSTAPDRIDLSEVARQAAGILNVRAREKNIVIEPPQLSEKLPAIAEFRRVLQVLLNLIGNAIRYSPDKSRIRLHLERRGDKAGLIVADEGPGISEEQQGRIFEKFERLGRSGDGGSGLGLYISRSLARAMGGDLTVESAPGQGARFILEVPVEPDAQERAA